MDGQARLGTVVMRRLEIFAALIVLTSCPAVMAEDGKRYAVLVGVKTYRHAGLPHLQYTERDVTELGDLLSKNGFHVTLLTTTVGESSPAMAPTQLNIEAALKETLDVVGKRDLVLVALAGHGLQPTGSIEQYFCPLDANPDTKASLISLAKLSQDMQNTGAGAKMLLVDACRYDPRIIGGRRGVEGDLYKLPPGASKFMAMFSCRAGERSYETEKAGGGHGLFFYYVIEGLKGKAALPDQNDVMWDSLFS
jgi:uncharacterized caspase-like protein